MYGGTIRCDVWSSLSCLVDRRKIYSIRFGLAAYLRCPLAGCRSATASAARSDSRHSPLSHYTSRLLTRPLTVLRRSAPSSLATPPDSSSSRAPCRRACHWQWCRGASCAARTALWRLTRWRGRQFAGRWRVPRRTPVFRKAQAGGLSLVCAQRRCDKTRRGGVREKKNGAGLTFTSMPLFCSRFASMYLVVATTFALAAVPADMLR